MKPFLRKLRELMPVRRSTMGAAIRRASDQEHDHWAYLLRQEKQNHAKEIRDTEQQVQSIIDRCTSITFDHDRDREDLYCISMEFSPQMMGILAGREEGLEVIAHRMSDRVFSEIVMSRFISAARERPQEKRPPAQHHKQ